MSSINIIYKILTLISYIFYIFNIEITTCAGERIRYISTEHPNVTYIDHKHVIYANLTSGRYGRGSPFYYVGLHYETTVTFDKNVTVDIYFYEYLSNVYKRGFVEMHFNFCELMEDNFFGAPMRQGKLSVQCPYPPGIYNLYNMSIDIGVIPRSFPFTKGRIYANVSYKHNLIGAGYIDMEVKEVNIKRQKII
ncbi:hypothetical protein ABMA27_001830 [Loxostege sticticalis]|uniref:MD-2-related lipid-recognition domain-containing protein n=1 Tax=Loxostege sticticalis TaxID=481309 RepID=A0ABR3HVM5_LOXSC